MTKDKSLSFISLGLQDYSSVLARQLELREQRRRGLIADTIVTVEHPPVITEGRRPAKKDYQVSPEVLRQRGIDTAKVNRGGRLTYHGPGQLVAYYIISLRERYMKVGEFVRAVEETALKTLASFGIAAERRKDFPGVWVSGRKIASIGLAVDRGVSMHGMALNIDPNLEHFQFIVPCGMPDCEMTSVERETGRVLEFKEVEKIFIEVTRDVFP
jgi:lipoate-protein ligase B